MKEFLNDESGASVVEVILILVILIAIVLIFKNKITTIINKAFKSMNGDANTIVE